VVRLGAQLRKVLAREEASEIFMPKRIRSYFMPIRRTPYVAFSLVRFGSRAHTCGGRGRSG
jgi:hypothetical protein